MAKKNIYKLLIIIALFFNKILLAISVNIKILGVNSEIKTFIENNLILNKITKTKHYPTWQIQHYYDSSNKEIMDLLHPFGFYNASIKSRIKKYNNHWDIIYNISPGLPTVINNINLKLIGSGKNNKYLQTILKNNPFKINAIIQHQQYEDFKNKLISACEEYGYFNAKYLTHKIIVNTKTNLATIDLILNTGEKFKFGKIVFKQPHPNKISPYFLKKFLMFKTNQFYNHTELVNLQNMLIKYFINISIETKPIYANNTIDIIINMIPKKKYQYKLGLGYSTNDGQRVIGSYKWRYIHATTNLFDISGKLSLYNNLAHIDYTIPGYYIGTDTLSFSYNYLNERKQNYNYLEKDKHDFTIKHQREYSDQNKKIAFGIHYHIERFQRLNNLEEYTGKLLIPFFDFYKLKPRLINNYSYLSRFKIQGAKQGIMASASYVKFKFSGTYLYYFNSKINLSLHTQIGNINYKNFQDIPPTIRFYTGGSQSVRGYKYQSISPVSINSLNQPILIGGSKLFVGNIDINHKIYKNWYANIFYDAGNATNSWHTIFTTIKRSTGFGASLILPIGSIKLNIAKVLDLPRQPWKLVFYLGSNI